MRIIRSISLLIVVLCLSGCGVGEFLVKRSINGIERDIAKQMKSYADFDNEQELIIEEFASDAAAWIKQSRLPLLHDELQLMASDIEKYGQLQDTTWQSNVDFITSPFALSKSDGLVEQVALFVYQMSDDHITQASDRLESDYQDNNQQRAKLTPEKRNKKIRRAIRILFNELGAPRTKEQIQAALAIFKQRRSWLDQATDIENLAHKKFILLINNRSISEAEFVQRFTATWSIVERGSRTQEPEIWQHNSQIGFAGINSLLSELDAQERTKVANNIRRYALLFNSFSSTAEESE